jgi:hypothetical protein
MKKLLGYLWISLCLLLTQQVGIVHELGHSFHRLQTVAHAPASENYADPLALSHTSTHDPSSSNEGDVCGACLSFAQAAYAVHSPFTVVVLSHYRPIEQSTQPQHMLVISRVLARSRSPPVSA